jgi:DNA-binding NarL/FixJ family response regulator
MVRVLLAVTHHLLRAALLEYLGSDEILCGEAASAEELWNHLRHSQWDVLILDLCLPQQTKVQTVCTVHGRYPNLPILAVSFMADIPAKYWQDVGASGFVSKTALSSELFEAVKVLSHGGKYFPNPGPVETIT